MTETLEILNQIKDDLENYFNTQNDYRYTPFHIKLGNYWWYDFDEKPVLCFSLDKDEPWEDEEHGTELRVLTITFYIYDLISVEGEITRILEIVEDLEDFLNNSNHFTYQSSLLTIGEINTFLGGKNIETGYTSIETQIIYEK